MSFGGRGKKNAAAAGSKGGKKNTAATGLKDAKKRKRDGKNSNSNASSQSSGRPALAAGDSTLISLALLLRASLASAESDSNTSSCSAERRLDPSLLVSGECTFLRGGSAHANSLLIFRDGGESSHHTEKSGPISSIFDLPSMPSDELTDDCTASSFFDEGNISVPSLPENTDTTKLEKVQRLTSLLETLRMKFVELTHSGRKSDNEKVGLIMSAADLESLDVLVQSIRLVHRLCQSYQTLEDKEQFLKELKDSSRSTAKRQSKKNKKAKNEAQDIGQCLVVYQTSVAKTLTLMLETFPIYPMDNTSFSRYELTNAGICSLLAELGGDGMFENCKGGSSSPQWINAVFSYILPRLNSTNAIMDEDEGGEEKKQRFEGIATNMLLKVVSKLLLPHDSERNYLLNNPLKRHELLQAFAGAFFPRLPFPSSFDKKEKKRESCVYNSIEVAGVEDNIKQAAPTVMGKTAAMLLVALIKQSGSRLLNPSSDDGEGNLHEKNSTLILQMASVLPIYLTSWEEKFPIETGQVFASFISLVRQWPDNLADESISATKTSLKHLCLGLRSSLDSVFLNSKKKPSIFESLPEQVQKLCVGLIGLLKCPSGALTKSLSSICAKASAPSSASNISEDVEVISSNMANYIMEVMHMLRQTMPMPNYLSFLIESCGLKHASMLVRKSIDQDGGAAGTDPLSESIFYYDKAIAQLSRHLTTSCTGASTKVLPMIRPILQKWISPSSTTDDVKQMVQARAAVSVLAAFTLDEVLSKNSAQSQTDYIAPEYLKLDDEFDKLTITCIMDQFELCAKLWSNNHYMDDQSSQQQFLARLLGPTTLILRYRRGMFEQFVQAISSRVVENRKAGKHPDEDVVMMEGEDSEQTTRINATEVHMNALLLILKSKDPISMTDLIRSSEKLQETLLIATEDMEKSVAGGHLAHLGSKVVHQAKLCKQ